MDMVENSVMKLEKSKKENGNNASMGRQSNQSQKIVVAMTSWKMRINQVHLVIDGFLCNTVVPDAIFLSLSVDEFPGRDLDLPESILKFSSNPRVYINWVDGPNLKPWKKVFPILEFLDDDDIIILADDDMLVPEHLVESRVDEFLKVHHGVFALSGCRGLDSHMDIPILDGQQKYDTICPTSVVQKKMLAGWEKFVADEDVIETWHDDCLYSMLCLMNGFPIKMSDRYTVERPLELCENGMHDKNVCASDADTILAISKVAGPAFKDMLEYDLVLVDGGGEGEESGKLRSKCDSILKSKPMSHVIVLAPSSFPREAWARKNCPAPVYFENSSRDGIEFLFRTATRIHWSGSAMNFNLCNLDFIYELTRQYAGKMITFDCSIDDHVQSVDSDGRPLDENEEDGKENGNQTSASSPLERIQLETDLVKKTKILLEELRQPEVIYNEDDGSTGDVVSDVALIQCFHGTDPSRIRATANALEFNLKMTSRPSTWVFVECQSRRGDCAFSWLARHGVKYVFVKSDQSSSDGIQMKNPLWNIGAASCSEGNLCFVDSDVVMCDSNWVKMAQCEFNRGTDVMSLASHQYYQADDSCSLHETIGRKWKTTGSVEGSHCGFTIGITRSTFELIGGFDPAVILDDHQTWRKIMGDETFSPFSDWVRPVRLPESRRLGYPVSVGCVEGSVACHIWHGDFNRKYGDLVDLLSATGIESIYDVVEYAGFRTKELPKWKSDDARSKALGDAVRAYCSKMIVGIDQPKFKYDADSEFRSRMMRNLGVAGGNGNPFTVFTVVQGRFNVDFDDIIRFSDEIGRRFKMESSISPRIVVYTDLQTPIDAPPPLEDFLSRVNVVKVSINEMIKCTGKQGLQKLVSKHAAAISSFTKSSSATMYYVPMGRESDFRTLVWEPESGSEPVEFNDGTILFRFVPGK